MSGCATCLGVLVVLTTFFAPVSGADIAVVLYMLQKSSWVRLSSENEGSSS